jgi:hypothetical protein
LATLAAGSGLFALLVLPGLMLGIMESPPGSGSGWGGAFAVLAVPVSGAVLGVVLGVLALVFPGDGHDRSLRRRVAWGGIAASLASAAGVWWFVSAAS